MLHTLLTITARLCDISPATPPATVDHLHINRRYRASTRTLPGYVSCQGECLRFLLFDPFLCLPTSSILICLGLGWFGAGEDALASCPVRAED